MYYLTIDTSWKSIVGVVEEKNGDVIELSSVMSEDARHHTETLIPLIDTAMNAACIEKPDVIIIGRGPASFTGLRAGIITARCLAKAWNVPLYGVSSLEVMALGGADAGYNYLVPIIDARRKELFYLTARPMGGDDIALYSAADVITPGELV
ncbi:MAG: tRNA (adenosine(37)-N6)-threonylcarbamoyltransferase complex dimerization subunit type 1 TsaB, partial [Actinomycetaceae bacterium]|nr:tRNA (adenosine(37)-N6)-threonylcarbamoyltransferase complex dimerization subunit type 1 TsaB [Actinomycetaceae bacterium]